MDLCKTRGIARHYGFETFNDVFEPVNRTLEVIRENPSEWNGDSYSSANTCLAQS